MKNYRISPTSCLNLYRECPACFWHLYNSKVSRPLGIFPSLPGGMDEVIKVYFDTHRDSTAGLPPELRGKIKGRLIADQALIDRWRNWRTGLSWETTMAHAGQEAKVTFFGALDECLIEGKKYMPLDYKTRGYPPRAGDSEKSYQTQLDSYAFLLERNGYQVGGHAYLVDYYPDTVAEGGVVRFHVTPVKVATDTERLEQLLRRAVQCLLEPPPAEHTACEYYQWLERLS